MWKDKIQCLFRYRKITPSSALWEQLEAQLAEREVHQVKRKYRKVWYYVAVALLLCFGIGYMWQQQTTTPSGFKKEKIVVKATEKESTSPADTTLSSVVAGMPKRTKISQSVKIPKSNTHEEALLLLDINEVDSLFTQYSADAIESSITQQMETQITADLHQLSPADLALIATTQAKVSEYVANKYRQDTTFNTIERDLLTNRIKLLARRLLEEVETRVVLNNKN